MMPRNAALAGALPRRSCLRRTFRLVWSGLVNPIGTAVKSVNMLEAKTHLSRLVDRIASGEEREIVIARNGRPAARLVPIRAPQPGRRIGLLKGKFKAPSLEQLDARDAVIARLFSGKR